MTAGTPIPSLISDTIKSQEKHLNPSDALKSNFSRPSTPIQRPQTPTRQILTRLIPEFNASAKESNTVGLLDEVLERLSPTKSEFQDVGQGKIILADDYALEEKIGEGAFGVVKEGRHIPTDEKVPYLPHAAMSV